MRKRLLAAVVAGSTALLTAPAASQAEDVDTTCRNGKDPVHYSLTYVQGVVRIQARVLCINPDK